jgi:hypothetical protein
LLDVRPLIRRIISLGAIVGGAETKIWTWSLLTTPLIKKVREHAEQHLPSTLCSDTLPPKQNDIRY